MPNSPRLSLIPPTPSPPTQLCNSPLSISPQEEYFQSLPPITASPKSSPLLSPVLQKPAPLISLLDNVLSTLFPSLIGFSNKSFFAKITALMACPAFLFLTLTLPVVNVEDSLTDDDEIDSIDNQLIRHLEPPTIVINDNPDLVIVPVPEKERPIGWNRWLTAVQFLFAPVFISLVLFSDDHSMEKLLIYSFIVGIVLFALCIFFTCDNQPPIFHSLLCYVGFGVAMVWIYLVANEVVSLLEALGLIMGVGDAILGLTIFAMGNSLGDLVANITFAKMGSPMMAMSACFGGPMLNILLGIGLGGTYVTAKTGVPYKIKVDPTLF
ncbi:6200_t:CDS:2, partial [Acaulospora morrowiae]